MSGTVVVAVDASVGVCDHKVVATAGTAVQLTTDTRNLSTGCMIRALSANTGKIYWGFTSGTSGVTSSNGFELVAGESSFVEIRHADVLWINSSVSGEGVCFSLI